MILRRITINIIICFIAIILVSCTALADSREFYLKGVEYYNQKEYNEAKIELLNAIKEDPNYALAHYKLAETYLKLKKYNLAYKYFLNVISLEPENYDAILNAGKIELIGGKEDSALERAHKILDRNPANIEALVLAAQVYATKNDNKSAIQALEKASRLGEQRAEIHVLLGHQYQEDGQIENAEKQFIIAGAIEPESTVAPLMLVKLYLSKNNIEKAIEVLKEASLKNPEATLLQTTLVELLVRQDKTKEAEKTLHELTQKYPDNQWYYLALGRLYEFLKKDTEAIKIYEQAVNKFAKNPLPLIALAKLSYKMGKESEAIQYLKNAQKLDEKSILPQIALAEIEVEQKKHRQALTRLTNILNKTPNDTKAQRLIAHLYFKDKQFDKALITYTEIINKIPNDSDAYFQRGRVHLALHNNKLGAADLDKAIKYNSHNYNARLLFANVLANSGDYSLAIDQLNTIIEKQKNNPKLRSLRGRMYLNINKLKEAKADFNFIIKRNPKSSLGYYNLGLLNEAENNLDIAYDYFMKALQIDNNNINALKKACLILIKRKKIDDAINLAKKHLAESNRKAHIHNLLGQIYLFDKKEKLAINEFKQSLQINPDFIDSMMRLGILYRKSNQNEDALAMYQKALKAKPMSTAIMLYMGETLEVLKKYREAEAVYRDALSVKSDYIPALNNLAYLLTRFGGDKNLNEALLLATQAKRLAPGDPRIIDTLAWVLYNRGAYSDAYLELKETSKKYPESPSIQYHMAAILKALKKNDEALKILKRVTKSETDFPEKQKAVSLIEEIERNRKL
jgi:tetratricopeptide (TPR) repeat protein